MQVLYAKRLIWAHYFCSVNKAVFITDEFHKVSHHLLRYMVMEFVRSRSIFTVIVVATLSFLFHCTSFTFLSTYSRKHLSLSLFPLFQTLSLLHTSTHTSGGWPLTWPPWKRMPPTWWRLSSGSSVYKTLGPACLSSVLSYTRYTHTHWLTN